MNRRNGGNVEVTVEKVRNVELNIRKRRIIEFQQKKLKKHLTLVEQQKGVKRAY